MSKKQCFIFLRNVDDVLTNPKHEYTQALIDAIPQLNPKNLYKEKNN